jgi:outer membrane protein assembly factor BamB
MNFTSLRHFFCTTLFFSACFSVDSGTAADWPQFLGPERNGLSTEAGWNSEWDVREPATLWRVSVGAGSASFAVVGGNLYTTGNVDDHDVIFCLDTKTGNLIWSHRYPLEFEKRMFDGGTAATPTVDGDRVYTLSHKGHLLCLDRHEGTVLWQRHLVDDFSGREPRWGYAGSPLVYGNLLITEPGGEGTSVVALNKLNGKTVWSSGSDGAAYASPTLYKTSVGSRVAVMNAFGLVGLDPANGRQLLRLAWDTSFDVNATTPLFLADMDHFFVMSGYRTGGGLVKLNGDTSSTLLYNTKEMKLKFQNAIRLGNRVYGVIDELKCLDLYTGKEVWDFRLSGDEGNVIAADGKLIILSEKGELVVGNPLDDGFAETGIIQVLGGRCWTLPVLANGTIYCRNTRGDLAAIDVR